MRKSKDKHMRNVAFMFLISFFLMLFDSCEIGHSEYYENGYNIGERHGREDVRNVKRVTEPSEYKYLSSDIFDADNAYETMKRTSASWGIDDSQEVDHRKGFIAGYEKGVDEELAGIGGNTSVNSNSYSSDSSSSSSTNSDETGISFWQWLIIIVVTAPVVVWLGFGKNTTDDNSSPEVKERGFELVKPWKSFVLILFVFIFDVCMFSIFDLRVNNWSSYLINIMLIASLMTAYENAKNWSNIVGAKTFCSLIRFLAVIYSLLIVFNFLSDLYKRFF